MRDLARSWLVLPLTLHLAGCTAPYVDLFPDSVSQISDGVINPSGRALPPAPFVCDTSIGERDAWFEPVTGPFRLRTKLRFLEPRLAAESLWPSVRLLLVTEDGIVAGGAQLANFLFAYVATARGANEASDEGPPRMLGVFALGDEVTFDLTWPGGCCGSTCIRTRKGCRTSSTSSWRTYRPPWSPRASPRGSNSSPWNTRLKRSAVRSGLRKVPGSDRPHRH